MRSYMVFSGNHTHYNTLFYTLTAPNLITSADHYRYWVFPFYRSLSGERIADDLTIINLKENIHLQGTLLCLLKCK